MNIGILGFFSAKKIFIAILGALFLVAGSFIYDMIKKGLTQAAGSKSTSKRFVVFAVGFLLIVVFQFLYDDIRERVDSLEPTATSTAHETFGSFTPTKSPDLFIYHKVTDVSEIENSIDAIRQRIEEGFSAQSFQRGAIYTATNDYHTENMSAQISDLRLGNTAYLYKNFDGEYVRLFVPVYFTLHIDWNAFWDEDTLENVVGYYEIEDLTIGSDGELHYRQNNYMSSVYFSKETVMVEKWLNGNGYIVESMPFK